MIRLQNISYEWEDGQSTLSNINIEIKKGEFILVSGKSGSGKSTLGSVINGLIPHYYKGELGGEVFVDGKDVSKMMLHEIGRIVGTVFQDPSSQFFTTTTDEEIAFGLQTIVKTKEEIRDRVEEVYIDLDMVELKDRSVFELSSGQKQKIAIASAYAMKPKILILDEPSANLDMKATLDLYRVLEKLKRAGTTIILIEHRLYYVKSLFDRFILIKNGGVECDYKRNELLEKEKSFFVDNGLRLLDLNDCVIDKEIDEKNDNEKLIIGKDLSFYYKCSHHRKREDRKHVFTNLNFEMCKGKVIGLIGLNGAGKTTLARAISGIGCVKEGRISDKSGKVLRSEELLKQSYFVFQDSDYQLFSESVLEEMLIGLSHQNKKESREKAILFLKTLGLGNYIEKHPFALSRGEKQRLTIACGLMKEAKLFIYDEPTSGCDNNSMLAISNLIRKQVEDGITSLIISHDFEMLVRTVDEVWVLENGQIKQIIAMKEKNKELIVRSMIGGEGFGKANEN